MRGKRNQGNVRGECRQCERGKCRQCERQVRVAEAMQPANVSKPMREASASGAV